MRLVVRGLVGSALRWECFTVAAWGCSTYCRVRSDDVPEWEGVCAWGGRDMGRGRGTVPRGMGAVVEAVMGVSGECELAGVLCDPRGG